MRCYTTWHPTPASPACYDMHMHRNGANTLRCDASRNGGPNDTSKRVCTVMPSERQQPKSNVDKFVSHITAWHLCASTIAHPSSHAMQHTPIPRMHCDAMLHGIAYSALPRSPCRSAMRRQPCRAGQAPCPLQHRQAMLASPRLHPLPLLTPLLGSVVGAARVPTCKACNARVIEYTTVPRICVAYHIMNWRGGKHA